MKRKVAWLLILSTILLLPLRVALAQAQDQARRKRVGLALSGGSAMGLAHIGVLKWFEENRIPVDRIAGTSMGGLVGGLYASGLSPAEMEEFIRQMDWEEVFALGAEYRQLTFRRKEDLRFYPNRFELGLRNGFQVPRGLTAGQGVGVAISRVAAPYSGMSSFDELPTPFRCVATDLVSGKEKVWEKGDLFDAMRSTMSIPAAFSPMPLEDKVYVDGGTLHNIPVEIVQSMGAELAIAVELNNTDAPPYVPSSAFDVLGRSISVMIIANELRSLRQANLVLSPELKGLTSGDFDKLDEFVQRGYRAAARQEQFLKTLSVSEEEWKAYLAERNAKRRSPQITPQFVELEGAEEGSKAALEKHLQKLAGQPLDTRKLEGMLTRLTGLGRYNTADYRVVTRGNEQGLLIKLHEKSYGPPILNTVIDVDGSDVSDMNFGIGARLTFMDLGGPFSEWRTDFNLGFRNSIQSEYYWRMAASPVFLAPRLFAEQSRLSLYNGRDRIAEYRTERLGGGMDLGLAAGRFNELRFGFEASHQAASVKTGAATLPNVEGSYLSVRGQWIFEGMDGPLIPRNGVRAFTRAQWVFESPLSAESYPLAEGGVTFARQFSRNIFVLGMAGGTTAGNTSPVFTFGLGGPLRLSALSRDQLLGNNYYNAGFFYLRSLSNKQIAIFGRAYFTAGYEIGNAFFHIRQANPFNDGVLGLVVETPLGGLLLGGSYGESGNRKLFFRLGRLF
jgi:NTE family protein